MDKKFSLNIVTPERDFFKGSVEELTINTPSGEMGVLYHTLPMIAAISAGLLVITQNGRKMEAACSDGFMRVGEEVTVLVQTCKWAYEVDESETDLQVKHLNDKIKKAQSIKEYKAAKTQLAVKLAKMKIKDKNV